MSDRTIYCSFCGKSNKEVAKIVAGPTVFICGGCVMICVEALIYGWKDAIETPQPIKDSPEVHPHSHEEANITQKQV